MWSRILDSGFSRILDCYYMYRSVVKTAVRLTNRKVAPELLLSETSVEHDVGLIC